MVVDNMVIFGRHVILLIYFRGGYCLVAQIDELVKPIIVKLLFCGGDIT